MRRWHKKNKKISTVPGHSSMIESAVNSITPPPPASTDPIIAQDHMQIDVIAPSAPQNLLDPTKATAYDQMQVDASLELMNPTVSNAHHPMQVGISGAGPSFSNPQGSSIASSSTVQEKGQADIGQGQRRKRKKWSFITASIGQDEAFNQVCNFLNDDDVGMVGIYGMGGVGKTTLMKKIRKEYFEPSNFKVILVVVSKSIDINNIQKDIMEGMGIMGLSFNISESRHTHAKKINEALDQEKVALLFDDIWECLGPTELEEIGILGPTELDPSILKIVFTTRSEKVCDQMEPDKWIKVECLGWDDSWALFGKSVGRKALESDYEIETIAKEIAKECKGLPLALTVIGRAMKWKKNRREYALITLQKSSSKDLDTEKQLFDRLKLSYDTLPDNGEKNCFLYCCLFPEDEQFEGDRLIEYWIAEGFLGLSGSYLEVSNRGADIIGTLQAACLLERAEAYCDTRFKMHDVVRDMGLWIASKLTLNIFIHGGSQLIKSEIEEKWREAHRIYVRRRGDGFPEQPLCPNLTTLIIDLAARERIKIWNSFFNSMGKLRVLELKNVNFGDEEVEIGQLLELRYLSVHNLRTCPADVIKLSKLEVLNLRENDDFEGVPENSFRHLVELRKLALDRNYHCFDAVIVEVGYLSKLEILNMHLNSFSEEFIYWRDESCEEAEDRVDRVKLAFCWAG